MSEHKPAEYINAVYEQTIKDLKERLAAETEKVEAFRDFMETEMGWEYFRAEMMYFDDKEKQRCSEENARKLKNFLVGGK